MTNRPLTESQAAILKDLRTMPKRCRHHNEVNGYITWEYIEHFDGRSLNSLCNRGLVEVSEYGIRAKQGETR
jgi:hypothetical protein